MASRLQLEYQRFYKMEDTMQTQVMENNSKGKSHVSTKMDQCIQNCLNCFRVCEQTLAEALYGNSQNFSQALILIKSCAEICHTSAKFMMMNSAFHVDTCAVCAKVCIECADTCESLGDENLRECIEACRKCAQSCSEMSKMSH
jgi:hypothetical protein